MGQKVSPTGFRTGITLGWKSTWYADKKTYGNFLIEDHHIRDYIDVKFNRQMPKGAVSKTEIVRTRNEVKVTLFSARPGMVIGPRGAEVDNLREELEVITAGQKVNVNVIEIKEPDLDAKLVAESIGEQLLKRAAYRRAMKQRCEAAMAAGAKGVKIICSGRLGGAEMSRKETQKLGSIPLHTLDANIDYALAHAKTSYGIIGIKVWIYKGKFGEEIKPTGMGGGGRRPRRTRTPRAAIAGGGPRPTAAKKPAVAKPTAEKPAEAPAAPAVEPKPEAAAPAEPKETKEQNDSKE